MPERKPVQLEMICVDFPDPAAYPDLYLGLVEKKEVVHEISLAEAHARGEVVFTTSLEALLDEPGQTITFYGRAAQGPPRERFVYLSWRRREAEGWQVFSRIKIRLGVFEYELVQQALQADRPLRLRARLQDRRGRPAAASLKGDQVQVLGQVP